MSDIYNNQQWLNKIPYNSFAIPLSFSVVAEISSIGADICAAAESCDIDDISWNVWSQVIKL